MINRNSGLKMNCWVLFSFLLLRYVIIKTGDMVVWAYVISEAVPHGPYGNIVFRNNITGTQKRLTDLQILQV